MKQHIILCQLLTAALLLTGCGFEVEGGLPEPAASGAAKEQLSAAETVSPEPQTEPASEPPTEAPFDFNDITDEQVLERLHSQKYNAELLPGYHVPAESPRYFDLFVPESDGDPMQALRDSEPNTEMTTLGENAFYGLADFPELDAVPKLVLKQFTLAGNGYAQYNGELDAESVLTNFDYITHDQKLLARWYRDDPEIKCVSYEFYAVKENHDGTAELGWYCYLIDREDHLVSLQPGWNLIRTITLDGSSAEPAPGQQAPVMDIELTLDKQELLIGRDDPQVVVRAVPPAEYTPSSVQLCDADTNRVLCELVDDCDYEAHGDNIQGDGWYCNRWTVPTDFGIDPDVSEYLNLWFYAQFEENGVLHRSEAVRLTVYEPFTEKELDGQQKVDDAVDALLNSDAWKQADTETRRQLALDCLNDLAEQGLLVPEYTHSSDDMVSYQFPSGVLGGIKLTPFDPRMN